MKYFNWIKEHKYPLVVIGIFIVGAMCIYFIIQGIHKDHSLDLVKMELKLKEESRLQIEQERKVWEQVIRDRDHDILVLRVQDSLVQQNILVLNNQLDKLSNQYNAKAKIINMLGSDDLLQYFKQLPVQPDNDY